MFDLIIKNGNIIDGTGNKPKKSDIGINADKIVTIGDLRDHEAKTIVEAEGLCVSPGFIDTHSHADFDRTAWHGPGDTSPVGHASNLALDLSCYNFGIQEYSIFGENTKEVFPGCPEVKQGMMWPNDKPGLGIDIDEKLAKKFPFKERRIWWSLGHCKKSRWIYGKTLNKISI